MNKVKIETHRITTIMGRLFSTRLPFLDDAELDALSEIGYSGKHLDAPTSREDYLNSLGKGTFQVTQTKWDSGSFREGFTVVRAWIEQEDQ